MTDYQNMSTQELAKEIERLKQKIKEQEKKEEIIKKVLKEEERRENRIKTIRKMAKLKAYNLLKAEGGLKNQKIGR